MKKVVIITGGLGNQMFQYALMISLRKRGFLVQADISYYDFFKMHNGYELDRVFGIEESLINKQGLHILWLRWLNKYRPQSLYKFDSYEFDEKVLASPKRYLFGYWQFEDYFADIDDQVRKTFRFQGIDDTNNQLAEEMQNCESISLHIRRGDYAQFGMSIVGEEYYRKAVDKLHEKIKKPVYYIFSDDMEAAERLAKNMGLYYHLISHNRGVDSYKDMYLMSKCKHNILANSSFSWWGAWLNDNPQKVVVAPKLWDTRKVNYKPQCNNWILV